MRATRRTFITSVAATRAALIPVPALAKTKLDEKYPEVIAFRYEHDSAKVDRKKIPRACKHSSML